MIRTAAVLILIVILVVIFQPQIKSAVMQARMSIAISRINLEETSKEQLEATIDRVASGLEQRRFSDVEHLTLQELLGEIRDYQGRDMPVQDAQRLIRRMEVVLERYDL